MKPILIISRLLKTVSHSLEYLLQNYVKIIQTTTDKQIYIDLKFLRHVLCKKALWCKSSRIFTTSEKDKAPPLMAILGDLIMRNLAQRM